MDNPIDEIITLLKVASEQNNKEILQLQDMLNQSEARIDRTNDMVTNLVKVCSGMKETYQHHIDQACTSRDNAMRQNEELIQELAKTQDLLKAERQRYDALLSTVLDMVKKQSMSVNINQ